MLKFKFYFLLLLLIMPLACAKTNLNPVDFASTPADTQVVDLPKNCAYLYEAKKWEVAVLEFNNNTGYGKGVVGGVSTKGASVSRTDTVGSGVVVGGRNAAVGVGATSSRTTGVYAENSDIFLSEFAPSLNTFAQSVTEETLASLGGVTVVNRSHIEKILQEQKFQMTMADQDTVVEFGKLSGVKYIFTGSVDNIETKYVAPTNLKGGESAVGLIVSMVSAGVDKVQQGWYVTVHFTLNMIDAETGKIIYSKRFKDSGRATQSSEFRTDLIINAAKGLFSSAVLNAKHDLTSVFEMRGYINEMKGGKKIAKINLGSSQGVKAGDVFEVYGIYSASDFLTKAEKCSASKVGVTITIMDNVATEEAWGYIKGKEKNLENLKIGSLVLRSSVGK